MSTFLPPDPGGIREAEGHHSLQPAASGAKGGEELPLVPDQLAGSGDLQGGEILCRFHQDAAEQSQEA